MSRFVKQTIDWRKVNPLMDKLVSYLSPFPKDPTLGKRISTWYNAKRNSDEDVLSSSMVEWILRGSGYLKLAATYLLKDAEEWSTRYINAYMAKNPNARQNLDASKTIDSLVYDFLGCDEQVSKWYNYLLQLIANQSRNAVYKRKASELHDQFFGYCINLRQKRLKNI